MAVTLHRLRPDDDAGLDAAQATYAETVRAIDPDAVIFGRAELVGALTGTGQEYRFESYLAVDDRQVLGSSLLQAPMLANRHTAHARVWVPPRLGQRGAGSALATHAEQWARDLGRRVLTCEVDQVGPGTAQHRAFAQRRGFRTAQVEQERRLPLPVPEQRWDELARSAAAYHPGYEIRHVIGPVPADLAPSFCETYNRLHLDAPAGELELEANGRTPAALDARYREVAEQGGEQVFGLALHAGEVVGLCTVTAHQDSRQLSQGSTIVRPDHRGHRLGLAVKVAAYRAAQHAIPGRAHVVTWNAQDNGPMIAVNEQLGFVLHGATATLQKTI